PPAVGGRVRRAARAAGRGRARHPARALSVPRPARPLGPQSRPDGGTTSGPVGIEAAYHFSVSDAGHRHVLTAGDATMSHLRHVRLLLSASGGSQEGDVWKPRKPSAACSTESRLPRSRTAAAGSSSPTSARGRRSTWWTRKPSVRPCSSRPGRTSRVTEPVPATPTRRRLTAPRPPSAILGATRPGLRAQPMGCGEATLTYQPDLLERIRLRLEDSVVGIGEAVAGLPAADVADLVNELTLHEAATVTTLLPVPRAIEVFDQPTLRRRGAIMEELDPGRSAQILEGLSADERTDIVRKMKDHARGRCMPKMSPAGQAEVEQLLRYPPRTAGAIMTTEFVRLDPTMKVGEALRHIRSVAREKESIYACYVMEP